LLSGGDLGLNLVKLAHLVTFLWLICLMLQVGFSVTLTQVWGATRHAKVLLQGLAVNFLIVPIIGFGLLLLFKADPMISLGFLIGICFSGAPMGPSLTGFSKGDLPFSIGLMVLLAALTPLISPAVLSLLLGFLPVRVGVGIDYPHIIRTILVGQILPLASGLALHGLAPSFARKTLAPLRITNSILVVAACVLFVASEYKTLDIFGVKAVIGIAALFVSSGLLAWLLGGPGTALKKAVTFNTTIRNVPVAMVIVSGSLGDTPALAATFAYSLFSFLGTILLALLLRSISLEPSCNPELPASG
jgi:BASS family bile acid:Na+ symporter